MTVAMWGGGTPADLATRIKTGDVALDFYRPVGSSAGTSPPTWAGRPSTCSAAGWHRRWSARCSSTCATRPDPSSWVVFVVERGAGAAGQLRDPVPGRHVGVLDPRRPGHPGPHQRVLAVFFSGLTVPLVLFPGWFGDLARALPWAAYLQAPADIWLGKRRGLGVLGGLGLQAVWAVVLLAGCAAAAPGGRAQGGGAGWLSPRPDRATSRSPPCGSGRPVPTRCRRGCSWSAAFLITGVEFVGIWIMFRTSTDLGGFTLTRSPSCTAAAGSAFAVADLFVGRIERLGQMIRLGKLDQMMVRPVAAADPGLRRPVRAAPARPDRPGGAGLRVGAAPTSTGPPSRVLRHRPDGRRGDGDLHRGLRRAGVHPVLDDRPAEVANAFTYGGNTLTPYPLTIFPARCSRR